MEIFGPSPLVRLGKSASNLFRKNGMPIFGLWVGSIYAKMSMTLKEEKFYHAERYKYLVLVNVSFFVNIRGKSTQFCTG